VLLEIYDSFRKENAVADPVAVPPVEDEVAVTVVTSEPVSTTSIPRKRAGAGGKRSASTAPDPEPMAPGA
jgi:hypothetical protein